METAADSTESKRDLSQEDQRRLARIEDSIWVISAQAGETEAFRRLVDRYERKLFYYLMRFVRDEEQALDLLQDTWVQVFRGLKKLRNPEAFRVWLYQVAHDRVVTVIRRQIREEELQENLAEEHPVDGLAESQFLERTEWVHQALDALPPLQREVLTLRFLQDLSLEEIAEALRCSVGTVKSRLHYAKAALRKKLEKLHE